MITIEVFDRNKVPRQPQMAHAIGCQFRALSPKNLVLGTDLRAVDSASAMGLTRFMVCVYRTNLFVFKPSLQLGLSLAD
jgi:hypothetical protein